MADVAICDFPDCGRSFEGPNGRFALAGHRKIHNRKDTSNTVTTEPGETHEPPPVDPDNIPWQPPKVLKPKVAGALVPYLSMAGLAVHSRNKYDGSVFANGIPPLIEALDDVAQENDALYKLLNGISKANSPTAKLVIALLAIVVPILANHHPESSMLRNFTGGLRMMPGTDIPSLPAVSDDPAAQATEDFVATAKTILDNMTDEDKEKIEQAISSVDLGAMMAQMPVVPGGMVHPEASEDAPAE